MIKNKATNNLKCDRQTLPKNKQKAVKFSNYIYSLLGVSSFTLLFAGLFNWFIDPQDIFKSPIITKINHEKVSKDNNDRLFKAVDIIRLQPKNVIMGSSRTKQGIDPDFLALQQETNYYNLAINGPNFYEVRRYIEHAIYNQPDLDRIILGVDFFMFNQNLNNQPTFSNVRLEKNHLIVEDVVKNLFSLDVVNNSIETIKASQKSPETINFDYGDNGFMPNQNIDNGKDIWRFHESIELYFKLHSDYQFSRSYFNNFKQLVELCKKNGIDLIVFISPAHATHWESIDATNKWSVFEQWKRELVEITPVWDFSGYNSITTEAISKRMSHYIDNSHYSPEVGNLILNRIFSFKLETVPTDFGIFITPENIEKHLSNIRLQRERWRQSNKREIDLVRNIKEKQNL